MRASERVIAIAAVQWKKKEEGPKEARMGVVAESRKMNREEERGDGRESVPQIGKGKRVASDTTIENQSVTGVEGRRGRSVHGPKTNLTARGDAILDLAPHIVPDTH
ncbi:hypothetical protein CC2G_007208 [Coprinopsis cinerea AmutBmut pab1-1]|nr:hypothetical protein CC2G_007208 [Coprinopsis cinerea AmutBmut pab1-1]